MLRRGFSLIELMVVVAVGGIVVQGYYIWKRAAAQDAVVQRTIDAVLAIDEAAMAFRADNPGVWPGSIFPALATGGYMPAAGASRLVGAGYALGRTVATAPLSIEVGMPTNALAEAVAAAFGPSGASTGSQVTVTVPIPGHESWHSGLVRRDGTAVLTGTLDMDGNGLTMNGGSIDMAGGDVNLNGGDVLGSTTVEAETLEFMTPVTVGDPCTTGSMGVDAAGTPAGCIGGVWAADPPCDVLGPAGGSRAETTGPDHWLVFETDCGTLAGIQFEGSNA